jgi:hypothetical protein
MKQEETKSPKKKTTPWKQMLTASEIEHLHRSGNEMRAFAQKAFAKAAATPKKP